MQESIVFSVRVQSRRKESSRSLSHLLMSFLFSMKSIALQLADYVTVVDDRPNVRKILYPSSSLPLLAKTK